MKTLTVIWRMFKKKFFNEASMKKFFVLTSSVIVAIIFVFCFISQVVNSYPLPNEAYWLETTTTIWENGIDSVEYTSLQLDSRDETANLKAIYNNSFNSPECQMIDVTLEIPNARFYRSGDVVTLNVSGSVLDIKLDFSEEEIGISYYKEGIVSGIFLMAFGIGVLTSMIARFIFFILKNIFMKFAKKVISFKNNFSEEKRIVESEKI